jgi:excisionase family DNA binding protein
MARVEEYTTPVIPTKAMAANAGEILRTLRPDGVQFALVDKANNVEIAIQEDVFMLFRQLLVDLAENRAIQLLPLSLELTTNQAAEILQVSRPYLVRLLTEGQIKHHMVGTHRRVLLEDVLQYKTEHRRKSKEARRALAKLGSEQGWE